MMEGFAILYLIFGVWVFTKRKKEPSLRDDVIVSFCGGKIGLKRKRIDDENES